MTSPDITSTANPRVKAWLALAKRSVRNEKQLFLIEGQREVARLQPHVRITETIWCEALADGGAPRGATAVSQHVFERVSHREHPDGVAAVASTPDMAIDQLMPDQPALVLVADGLEKPGNIGAILRTCDALGAAFIGSGLATDLVNPNVIRAAQGSLFAVPTASVSRAEAREWCATNTNVFVTRPDDTISVWDTEMADATSIVIGAEASGVGTAWEGVGEGIAIPMSGTADSFNASVTAAIVLAEARRQRSG